MPPVGSPPGAAGAQGTAQTLGRAQHSLLSEGRAVHKEDGCSRARRC